MELAAAQKALILAYREKQRAIALSTARIDRAKARESIYAVYSLLKLEKPAIAFCASPYEACYDIFIKRLLDQFKHNLGKLLEHSYKNPIIYRLLDETLGNEISFELTKALNGYLWNQLKEQLSKNAIAFILNSNLHHQSEIQFVTTMRKQLKIRLSDEASDFKYFLVKQLRKELRTSILSQWSGIASSQIDKLYERLPMSWLDFGFSGLGYNCDRDRWNAYQTVMNECGCFIAFQKICYVCDRPIHLSFDNEGNLHGEGKPAIEFADGFCVYIRQGKLVERF